MNIKPSISQPDLLVQPFAPTLNQSSLPKILERKADINVKDLLTVAPGVKRALFKAIKASSISKNDSNITLNYFEDDDVDTTAIYTDFYVKNMRVRSMLDTGSAKTCMSKDIADNLQLVIDAPSTSVFTLGNGTKQASLGIVYDVPLNLGGSITIPGSIAVLPVCPANLIIGNNWMKRAKAKLNLEEKVNRVEYKAVKAKCPFTYTKTLQNRHVTSTNMKYAIEGNTQNNIILPVVRDSNNGLASDDGYTSSENDSDVETEEPEDDINEDLEPESSDSDGDMFVEFEALQTKIHGKKRIKKQ
ncbi:protein translocase subunit [Mucor velutinosus]|uniref:Protein translocase subunit n=1 Tax=Mucor velutinosus TaxID=708070 RepID=A0AAN7DQP7_9FUNG|nr:protein translocase subunit [Mucor velutinosus]